MPDSHVKDLSGGPRLGAALQVSSGGSQVHLTSNAGVYRIEYLAGRRKLGSTNAMLWLVMGVSSLGRFHILGHTPGAQGVHPSRPATDLRVELTRRSLLFLQNEELDPARFGFSLLRADPVSGIVAIVIALRDDLAIPELQKRSEVGAHLGSGGLGLKRHGQGAGPENLERDSISTRQFTLDFIPRMGHGLPTAVGGGAYSSQVVPAAVRKESARKDFHDR